MEVSLWPSLQLRGDKGDIFFRFASLLLYGMMCSYSSVVIFNNKINNLKNVLRFSITVMYFREVGVL